MMIALKKTGTEVWHAVLMRTATSLFWADFTHVHDLLQELHCLGLIHHLDVLVIVGDGAGDEVLVLQATGHHEAGYQP